MTPIPLLPLAALVLAASAPHPLDEEGQPGPQPLPPQPAQVRAVHFSGQTFLTWSERPELHGESYRIYRSQAPIVDVRARSVREVPFETWEGSGIYYAGRVFDDRPCEAGVLGCGRPTSPVPCFRPRYVPNLWIPDGAGGSREVQAGEGLLVWTLRDEDFPSPQKSGPVWYAVTTVTPEGYENPLVAASNRALVDERVDEPLPVEVPRTALDCSSSAYCPKDNLGTPNPLPVGVHLFFQFMDLREWNSTFHAPNALNCWWGEDPNLVRIRNARQYAYAYTVSEPDPALGPVTGALPVVLDLHRHAENALHQGYGAQGIDAYAEGGQALKVIPIDVGDTWWYGFVDTHDYRQPYSVTCRLCRQYPAVFPPPAPWTYVPKAGTVVNFTEFRLLRMLRDLERAPLPGFPVDPDRRYVRGMSMGGSGALALALRYPDVFAAAAAGKPMTDYLEYLVGSVAPAAKWDFRHELPMRWGAYPGLALASGLPLLTTRSITPPGWGEHLKQWDGLVVWDWQDHVAMSARPERQGEEIAPFGILSGIKDKTLPYATQGEPFYESTSFPALGRAWGGEIACEGHAGGSPEQGMPPSLASSATNPSPGPFSDYSIRLGESVPGLGSLSGYQSVPEGTPCTALPPGGILGDVEWSSSWFDWDATFGPPRDQPDRWEVSLRWSDPAAPAPTVSVVPRRLQQFVVGPGFTYRWMNVESGTGVVLQPLSPPMVPAGGILRIDGVQLSPLGSRLTVIRFP